MPADCTSADLSGCAGTAAALVAGRVAVAGAVNEVAAVPADEFVVGVSDGLPLVTTENAGAVATGVEAGTCCCDVVAVAASLCGGGETTAGGADKANVGRKSTAAGFRTAGRNVEDILGAVASPE